ncbi:MFS transporter [Bordetella sp. LUAb4]|uniref:MFS transporter n=1 Tax=Bordetella sp. LUAb4 TaxID=2843195 RepID=UPI001E4C7404|nr:MFS transporter [Bordetella sp. LUAb4]
MSNSHRRTMVSLLTISFLNSGGVFVALPIMPLYAHQALQLSIAQIGTLSAIWPTATLLLSTPLGILGEKIGYANIIRASLSAGVAAYFLMGLHQSVLAFATGLLLFGCSKAAINSTVRAAMTRVCEPHKRERYFRFRYLLINCGGALGPLCGIYLYNCYGALAFLGSCALLLLALLTAIFGVRPEEMPPCSNNQKISMWDSVQLLADRRLFLWTLSFALVLASFGAYETFIPIVAANSVNTRPQAGLLFSINAVTVVAFQALHFRLFKRCSSKQNCVSGFLLMVLGFFLISFEWNAFVLSIVGVIIFSIGETFLFPSFDTLLDQIAPEDRKALYFGAGETKQIGFLLGPIGGGFAYAQFGSSTLLILCAVLILISAILFRFVFQATKPDDAAKDAINPRQFMP